MTNQDGTEDAIERVRDQLRKEGRSPDAKQRFWLRWIVIGFSAAFIFLLGYLEYYLFVRLSLSNLGSNDLFVVLCIAPIVAATTIVVFMLIGVFRPLRANDMDELPLEALRRALLGDGA